MDRSIRRTIPAKLVFSTNRLGPNTVQSAKCVYRNMTITVSGKNGLI